MKPRREVGTLEYMSLLLEEKSFQEGLQAPKGVVKIHQA